MYEIELSHLQHAIMRVLFYIYICACRFKLSLFTHVILHCRALAGTLHHVCCAELVAQTGEPSEMDTFLDPAYAYDICISINV